MNTSDEEEKQINLSHREAAELASQATQDDGGAEWSQYRLSDQAAHTR
jgi:hypothetical protein